MSFNDDGPKLKSFMATLLNNACGRVGAKLIFGPKLGASGQIHFVAEDRYVSFFNCCFDVNPYGSSLIARNKGLTRLILEKEGFPFLEGEYFSIDHDKYSHYSQNELNLEIANFAERIKYPVMVKGADLHRGSCVNRVDGTEELLALLPKVWSMTPGVIIEKYEDIDSYRILVFKNEIVAVYAKIPFNIVGDGINRAEELIEKAKLEGNFTYVETSMYSFNDKVVSNLKKRGYDLKSIIPAGKKVVLLEAANISNGATPQDCTKIINKNYRDYVGKIMKFLNLKLAGIDILTSDITLHPKHSYILEVNSSPSLESYAKIGEEQEEVIKSLMTDIVLDMKGL